LVALLSILSSLLVGVVLVFAPWMSFLGVELWESNWFLQLWPGARGVLLSPFTRGAVTGIGLVNLALAARDASIRVAAKVPRG
jgi:hypothetical protein